MPVVSDLLLGYLLYKSHLVPRVLPLLAFIGAPLHLASDFAVLFGLVERVSALPGIAALPVALFEFSLGVYLTVKVSSPRPLQLTWAEVTPRLPAPLSIARDLMTKAW
jgi:hypothetical protein